MLRLKKINVPIVSFPEWLFKDKVNVQSSVTRLGNFWKFLAINFLSKVVQIFADCLGYVG